ncbi:MAG: cytochrome C [Planctomycetota bacterium]|nr:MAG: cytochrome C [Planctomycetota bacterium]
MAYLLGRSGWGLRVWAMRIEPIMPPDSKMMHEIRDMGADLGDPEGCTICHGGDPEADTPEAAHSGDFYPDPGSPWINENTCGQCHMEHIDVQWSSLMMTEAGKIQGVCWTFGGLQTAFGAESPYEHFFGNYDYKNPDDPAYRLGTDAYRTYMAKLKKLEPQVFVDEIHALPEAPTDPDEIAKNPEYAAFTYLRNQCLRCHHAVKGRQVRGDYRGMGCSSCHIPYSNEGYYEGNDKNVPHDEAGHMLVHSIQATREVVVKVHDVAYSGIPVETCTTCHDRGKRIGVSFQGLMETAYESPFTDDGGHQPALHTKHYLAMEQDVHYQKGMLCMDCHTSGDVHGDGFLACANLGAVEIECTDCHGTPDRYPWELPLGYGDEFDPSLAEGPPRGTTNQLPEHIKQATVYPAEDGFLLSARGNPLRNVVRRKNTVVVHTAAGNDLELKPLKAMVEEKLLSTAARTGMVAVGDHIAKMECYTCHAGWAPQCYGCHVRIDYSNGNTCFDWLGAGHRHASSPEHACERGEAGYPNTIPGKIEEQRSYLRWEDPILGVNGEQRITPVAPGCQPVITIIGPDGEPIMVNHLYRSPPGTEGGGPEGQATLDMSPLQPHTNTGRARPCESCHLSEKALGYGIDGGRTLRPWNEDVVVDLETADKQVLPKRYQVQRPRIEGLEADWSRIVDEEGNQLMTVGHHFSRSRALNNEERAAMDRRGVCLACHQEIPKGSFAVDLLHHVAEATGQMPKNADDHNDLVHKILLVAGWGQVAVMFMVPFVVVLAAGRWMFRRRKRRKTRSKK